jgi:hypothetical protein
MRFKKHRLVIGRGPEPIKHTVLMALGWIVESADISRRERSR